MAEFKTIPIDQIIIPERLREVEEDHALAISQSIVEHGLLNPITVRPTPASKGGNYTLIAGAHRLRAMVLLEEKEIDAVLVAADRDEALLLEITENVFRNDLSKLDRAIFVTTYRDVWERKYGKVEAGRPGNNRANIAQLIEDEATAGFSLHVAERLGLSRRAVEYAQTIGKLLHRDLRQAIRGTSAADNQSALLKLAKFEPAKQRQAAIAFREVGDLKRTFEIIDDSPKMKPDKQVALLSSLIDAWDRASEATKAQFMSHAGLGIAGEEPSK